jgi:hypothetical protein
VSCVPLFTIFSGLSFFITPSVFSNIYLCCTLCTLCGQFLWIVPFLLPLSIFSNICLSCVLCTLCCQFLWIVPFLLPLSVLSNIYLCCTLCTLCCQFLLIVLFYCPLWYSLTFICDNVFSNVFVTYGYGLDNNVKPQK